jgi:hypothetical protein
MVVTAGATAVGGGDFTVEVDSLIFLLVLVLELVLVLLFVDCVMIGSFCAAAAAATTVRNAATTSFFILIRSRLVGIII